MLPALCACGKNANVKEESDNALEGAQIANPFTYYEKEEDMETNVGFNFKTITLKGYEAETYSVMENEGKKFAEAQYVNGEKKLCLRQSKDIAELNGDYSEYSEKYDLTAVTVTAKCQGTKDGAKVIEFSNNGIYFCIMSDEPLSNDTAVQLISQLL